jgi:hypothetical protein
VVPNYAVLSLGLAATVLCLIEFQRLPFKSEHAKFYDYFMLSWIVWTSAAIVVRVSQDSVSLVQFPAPFHAVVGYHFALGFRGIKRDIAENIILVAGYASTRFSWAS